MCKTPHKHAELIKAWADGAVIQFYDVLSEKWKDCNDAPRWLDNNQYRIKPEQSDLEKYGVEVGDVWVVEPHHKVYLIICVQDTYFRGRSLSNGAVDLLTKQCPRLIKFRRGVVNKL